LDSARRSTNMTYLTRFATQRLRFQAGADSELLGERHLNPREKVRYARRALGELVASCVQKQSHHATFLRMTGPPLDITKPPPGLPNPPSPHRLYQVEAIQQLLPIYCPASANILDIGCGSGGNELFFRARGVGGNYLGIDVHFHADWQGRSRAAANTELQSRFIVANAECLDGLADFDLVFSNQVLEHVERIQNAVAEIHRVTRVGGISLHTVPSTWAFFLYGQHGYRRFSPSTLGQLFENAAFRILELRGLAGFGSFLVHFLCITIPSVVFRKNFRRRFPGAYRVLVLAGLKLDRLAPWPNHGYVIVAQKTAPSASPSA
jgi:SAM-dependent methyltransferase